MEVSLKTIISRVRPCRCAVLINQTAPDWHESVLSVIEWQSTFWGGADTIIIPTDGKNIDAFFWAILEIYKPDYFYRYIGSEERQKGPFGLKIDPSLDKEIRRRLNPFYFGDKASLHFIKDGEGTKLTIPIRSLQDNDEELVIHDYVLSGVPQDIELLVRAKIGSSKALANIDRNKRYVGWPRPKDCKVMEFGFDVKGDQIKQLYTNQIDGSLFPFTLTAKNLSRYYIPKLVALQNEFPDAPKVIIIFGDSLADYTAFFSLSRISEGIFWVPIRLFQEEYWVMLLQILGMVLLVADYDDMYDTKDIQVISLSKNATEIAEQFDKLYSIPMFQSMLRGRQFIVGQRFDIHNLFVFRTYERGNQQNISLHQFIDNKSASLFEIPKPAIIDQHALTTQWMVELEVLGEGESFVDSGYILPENPIFGSHLLFDLAYAKNDPFVRVDRHCFVLKCPQSGIVRVGTTLNDYLVSPRISVLSNYEIFKRLFESIECDIKVSDKGNFMSASIELFGSVEKLAQELHNPAVVRMFDMLMDESKPGDRAKKGIRGVLVGGRVYLCFEDVKMVFDNEEMASEKIDEYVRNRIFTKGFIFQCERCSAADWYRLEQVGQNFSCRRCNLEQIFSKQHWKDGHQPSIFYKVDEMFYQGYKNNMRVPIMTLASLRAQASKSFIYIPEVVLVNRKNSDQKSEIDILCIQDGKLIIGECKKDNSIDNRQLNRYHHLVNAIHAHFLFASLSKEISGVKSKVEKMSWEKEPILMSLG